MTLISAPAIARRELPRHMSICQFLARDILKMLYSFARSLDFATNLPNEPKQSPRPAVAR